MIDTLSTLNPSDAKEFNYPGSKKALREPLSSV